MRDKRFNYQKFIITVLIIVFVLFVAYLIYYFFFFTDNSAFVSSSETQTETESDVVTETDTEIETEQETELASQETVEEVTIETNADGTFNVIFPPNEYYYDETMNRHSFNMKLMNIPAEYRYWDWKWFKERAEKILWDAGFKDYYVAYYTSTEVNRFGNVLLIHFSVKTQKRSVLLEGKYNKEMSEWYAMSFS